MLIVSVFISNDAIEQQFFIVLFIYFEKNDSFFIVVDYFHIKNGKGEEKKEKNKSDFVNNQLQSLIQTRWQ